MKTNEFSKTSATMGAKTLYTFDSDDAKVTTTGFSRKNRRAGQHSNEEGDPTDGSGSLTYSAASSINSAGESTDSSFADIMKVLDLQDPNDIANFRISQGMTPEQYRHVQQQSAKRSLKSGDSVASSLQYSTDGESNLHGTDLISTITGQPSDSGGYDGGNYGYDQGEAFDNQNILFAPAEPTDSIQRRKQEKKRNKRIHKSRENGATPKVKNTGRHGDESSTSTPSVQHSNKGTPPPLPPPSHSLDDDDICYAQWWMSCFPDAFKNMMPKR